MEDAHRDVDEAVLTRLLSLTAAKFMVPEAIVDVAAEPDHGMVGRHTAIIAALLHRSLKYQSLSLLENAKTGVDGLLPPSSK